MKKSWNKPELTVLVRTRPEEAILGLCKNTDRPGGNADMNSQCKIDDFGCGPQCQTQLDS